MLVVCSIILPNNGPELPAGMSTQEQPSFDHIYTRLLPVHNANLSCTGSHLAHLIDCIWMIKAQSDSLAVSHTHRAFGMFSFLVSMYLPLGLQSSIPIPMRGAGLLKSIFVLLTTMGSSPMMSNGRREGKMGYFFFSDIHLKLTS